MRQDFDKAIPVPQARFPFTTLLANDTINGNRAVRVQKPSGMTRKRSKNGLILISFHSVCHSQTKSYKTLLANDTINGNRAVRVQKPSGMTRKRSKNGLILTSFHSVCHSPTKSYK